jgi:hypothetical protein
MRRLRRGGVLRGDAEAEGGRRAGRRRPLRGHVEDRIGGGLERGEVRGGGGLAEGFRSLLVNLERINEESVRAVVRKRRRWCGEGGGLAWWRRVSAALSLLDIQPAMARHDEQRPRGNWAEARRRRWIDD